MNASTRTRQLRVRSGDTEHTLPVGAHDATRTLADFLGRHGLPLNTRCGGRGLCNGCQVQFSRAGDVEARAEKACRLTVADSLARCTDESVITIPARSLLRQRPSVVDDFRLNIPSARDPIDAHAGYGAAVDIGTTTVALLLCDLATGKPLARASAFNAQIRHGEDVLTRIELCSGNPAAVRELQRAIAVETIQPLLAGACARAGIAPADVGVMVVAGNTVMQHLLAGENPRSLGVHPFTPVFLDHRVYAPGELGLAFGQNRGDRASSAPAPLVHLLPGLSSYVGADLAAGIIATGLVYENGPVLLVDIGTNGEIIAKTDGKLIGCATAAGPAFEGAGLTCGTRAVDAAIQRVRLETNPFSIQLGLIGDGNGSVPPVGVCGSGFIDFLWEARRAGLLLGNGRYAPQPALPPGACVENGERGGGQGRTFCISPCGASGPLWISEMDIVRLLQAKAAIAAGIVTLLDVLDIRATDVKRLYLAGGFGMHLSLEHAIGCGLLPGFTPGQIQIVGNTSLGGAYLALNDRALLDEMRATGAGFHAVELNRHPGFEDAYIDNLALP